MWSTFFKKFKKFLFSSFKKKKEEKLRKAEEINTISIELDQNNVCNNDAKSSNQIKGISNECAEIERF